MFHSLRGHFLVAGCRLRDANFFKTAVLMVEHTEEGAMGLVVNRPSTVTVAHALAGHFDLPSTDDLVYFGGPVEPNALFILHNSDELDPTETPVVPGLFVGSSTEVFEDVVRASLDDGGVDFRIFSGCAGWGPGQLECELARCDWFSLPATESLLFQNDPYSTWDLLLSRVYEANRLLPHLSQHPEWN